VVPGNLHFINRGVSQMNLYRTLERGAALIESLLAYPLLLLICLGLFDLTRIATQYSILTVVAREVVVVTNTLKGVPLAGLDFPINGVINPNLNMGNCFDASNQVYAPVSGYESACAEATIQLRLARLIQANGFDLATSKFKAKVIRNVPDKTVRVELQNPYAGTIASFKLFDIKSAAEGPYEL
jgi:hypothetical protein